MSFHSYLYSKVAEALTLAKKVTWCDSLSQIARFMEGSASSPFLLMSRDSLAVAEQTLELIGCETNSWENGSAALLGIWLRLGKLSAGGRIYQAIPSGQNVLPVTSV